MTRILPLLIAFAPASFALAQNDESAPSSTPSPVTKSATACNDSQNTDASLERRVEELLSKLTLAEKVNLCSPKGWMEAGGVPRLGIGPVKMADGPQGVTRHTTPAAFPCGVSLSCTWNTDAARLYGETLGEETLGVGRHMILGPAVNLMRTPLCGRTFEYYGEDPVVAGNIAAAYIRGVQSKGVSTSLKHLVANNQENHRWLTSANVDERTLRELYLRAFEIAVKESHPWCVMSSYNRLNGVYMAHNGAIQEGVVKKEWGFDGVMVSDWNAVHDAKAAALGGLDLEMGSYFWTKNHALENLVKSGEVPESVLDEKARRMLRLMFRTGVIGDATRGAGANDTSEHRSRLRALAAEGMVLLKNAGATLPLDAARPGKILVTGPNAAREHRGGGGSGGVYSPYEITPLQGLTEVFGDRVQYVPGYTYPGAVPVSSSFLCKADGTPGLACEFFGGREFAGEPVVRADSLSVNFKWGNAMFGLPSAERMPTGNLSVRITGKFVAPFSGEVKLGVNSDGARLVFDGKTLVDQWGDGAPKPGPKGDIRAARVLVPVQLVKGRAYDITLEYRDRSKDPELALLWESPKADPDAAVAAARDADTVIFVGGTHHGYDSEGAWGESAHDIPNVEMPGPQAELINKLAAANKRVVIVLVNGSVVSTESWIEKTPAVVEAWYGGQESGHALADILTGKVNPSGKLTATFGKKLTDYACHAQGTYPGKLGPLSVDPHSDYKEGVFIGYRWFEKEKITPRFPFGYGLSYTTFAIDPGEITVGKDASGAPVATVVAKVTNTGAREGGEVVQLYVGENNPTLPRPVKELKAFAKVFLKPGETKSVTLTLDARAFAFRDVASSSWKINPGRYTLTVGNSSDNAAFVREITL